MNQDEVTGKKVRPGRLMLVLLLSALVCLALWMVLRHSSGRQTGELRLGVQSGAPAVISSYLTEHYHTPVQTVALLDVRVFQDCCSNQAQLALGAGDLEMAVLCSDAARSLLEQDSRYEQVGIWVSGSDVLVLDPQQSVYCVAVAAGRSYQADLVRAYFGSACEIRPIMPTAIPLALESGAVQAAVMDAGLAGSLPDNFTIRAAPYHEGNRYVLVAMREIMASPEFEIFMRAWSQTAVDLQDPVVLETAIRSVGPESAAQTVNSERKKGELWSQVHMTIPVPVWPMKR